MTTRITVKNEGPDKLLVRYYNRERQFIETKTIVPVGASIDITVWDGNLPVMWPVGDDYQGADGNKFCAVPPATY